MKDLKKNTARNSAEKRGGSRKDEAVLTVTKKAPPAPGKVNKNSKKKSTGKADKKASAETEESREKRRQSRTNRITVILFVVAALLLICMIFDTSSMFILDGVDEHAPDRHLLGMVGFWIFRVIYGIFGYSTLLLPFIILYMAIRWRRISRDNTVAIELFSACVIIILFTAFIHLLTNWDAMAENSFAGVDIYFNGGHNLSTGGVIGGVVAFGLKYLLNYVGTIILCIVSLLLATFSFLSLDPVKTVVKFIEAYNAKAPEREKARAARLDEKRRQKEKEAARKSREAEERAEAERLAAEEEIARRGKAGAESKEASAKKHDDTTSTPTDDTVAPDAEESVSAEPEEADHIGKEDKNTKVTVNAEAVNATDSKSTDAKTGDTPSGFTCVTDQDAGHDSGSEYDDDLAAEHIFPRGKQEDITVDLEDDTSVIDSIFNDEKAPEANAEENNTYADEDEELPEGIECADDDDSAVPDKFKSDTVSMMADEFFGGGDADDTDSGESETEVDNKTPTAPTPDTADGNTGDIPQENIPPEYVFPPFDLLTIGNTDYGTDMTEVNQNIQILRDTLESFKIKVKDIACTCGPTITRYEVKPEAGVRVRTIAVLQDDIAMNLAKSGVRIEAPIPGKPAVGIEVPNEHPVSVNLRNLIDTNDFKNHKSKIASVLGVDIGGKPIFCDLEKMPHMLIAGTTGSGKSVCINSIIMSILYHAKPDEVKLVLIDPKKVEFNVYKDIPHLCTQIVSDPKRAAGALQSAVNVMEHRFEMIEDVGVRNIQGYNEITKNDPDKPYMPRIVIIIDELADLMMTAKEEVETAICRIAQKARAAGIHLIVGTQRPSVDVITGLIKANVPSRIAFTVASQVDSRTIIDIGGAEKLCGRGDMLYAPVGFPKPLRVQGAFVSDSEVEKVVSFVKSHNAPVCYDEDFTRLIDEEAAKCGIKKNAQNAADDAANDAYLTGDGEDPKLWDAVRLAVETGKLSTSLMQRKLEVGYGRAAKILDRMEELGFISAPEGNKPRKLLITEQDFDRLQINRSNSQ